MADWVTISSLATAGGTLALAVSTFAAVRSSNRSARVAELSVMANMRPLLMQSRLDDPEQKVGFQDNVYLHLGGGQGAAQVTDGAVYLAISLRNLGAGTALLHGWKFWGDQEHPDEPPASGDLTRLTRDIYVAAGDVGFWQGTFRDPASEQYLEARRAIEARHDLFVDVMYGDLEGGQRTVTRFAMRPVAENGWLVSAGRVWNIDRAASR